MNRRDRNLERRLRELRAPDEADAEERSLALLKAAYEDHVPLRPSRAARRIGLGVACGAVALAIGLSPAGAKVGDLVSDVLDPEPAGEPNARPALRSLPVPGALLVESPAGPWIVRADGSKRLLGEYGDATWSPHGLYVAAAADRELVALDTTGAVRWTYPAPAQVHDPRWAGNTLDTRIAYRSDGDLRVIAGDGNPASDHVVAHDVAAVAPVWRPGDRFVIAYVHDAGGLRAVDADTGEPMPVTRNDRRRLSPGSSPESENRVLSPDGSRVARLDRSGGRDRLIVTRRGGGGSLLFGARGKLTGPTWSPDGRWLLIGWPAADQWLFVDADHPKRVEAFERISEQFSSGPGRAHGRFPAVSGWLIPSG